MQEHAGKKEKCNFPIPPMPSTVILQPLNDDDESKGVAEQNYLKIATHMNEIKMWMM